MVDLSSSLCKHLPEGRGKRFFRRCENRDFTTCCISELHLHVFSSFAIYPGPFIIPISAGQWPAGLGCAVPSVRPVTKSQKKSRKITFPYGHASELVIF
jgi:hypothetical protein